jgi:hypothetical protein
MFNIFSLVSEVIAVLLANAGAIETLIAAKNWVGLTEELVTLAEQIVGTFQAKHDALAAKGVPFTTGANKQP